jgi:uncharacterized lipoprotein YddW (UPF0748 family)
MSSSLTPRAQILATTVIVLLLYAVRCAYSQRVLASPKQEVRAVWIATTAGLDWPRTLDRADQQSSLRKIVADMKAAHFNTILFQARARGDAYYRSSYEPWAENLNGTLGKDPGWDPLEFVLNEAHKAGIEVHAWFNVYKIRGSSSVGQSVPLHPARRFAAWVHEVDGEGWIDPGVPEVRDYLVRVALEIVRRYDIDGINFDFIRYPGNIFPDAETYRRYGAGIERDDWRRSNIDRFVTAFYDSAMRIKPMLKVGTAPLGVFSNGSGSNAWGAFNSYYQDSQGWLRKGKHDYLSPQLYWNLGATKDDPDFAELLRAWKRNSYGREIWAGIGAYKPEVIRELPRQIDSSRSIGADGQAYFRYEHVNSLSVLGGRYATLANIPPMSWKDSIPPLEPTHLAVSETAQNVFHLEWLPPQAAADGDWARYYNIYRSTSEHIDPTDVSCLVAITNSDAARFVDTVRAGTSYKYYYAVSALDKGNNESAISNVATITMRELTELRGKLSDFTSLSTSVARDNGGVTLVAYKLALRSSVSLRVVKQDIDSARSSAALVLASGMQSAGTYVVGVARSQLKPGSYLVRLDAGGIVVEQPLEIRQ